MVEDSLSGRTRQAKQQLVKLEHGSEGWEGGSFQREKLKY